MIRLVLFDIDGTLVRTGGAGTRAMARAFDDVFGLSRALDGVSVAGRTDAWILGEVARRHRLDVDLPQWDRLRLAYYDHLRRELLVDGPGKGVLPGVPALLERLHRQHVAVALLTGNTAIGARIKLEYFDLWRYFPWGVFGDAAHDRNTLLAEAFDRLRTLGLPAVQPHEAVVVGDTPFDIAVAAAGGARSVGVATGPHDQASLDESGATATLGDLGDLDAALRALGVDTVERPGPSVPA